MDTIDLLIEDDSFPHRNDNWLKCTGEMNKQNLKLKDQTSSNQPKLNQEQKKSQVGI